MALPALPPNNTDRYFVDYSTPVLAHTLVVRTVASAAQPAVDAAIFAFLGALEPLMADGWNVTGVRYQARLTDFSLPVDLPDVLDFAATNAGQALPAVDEPRQWKWTGRSEASGRQVSVGVFGLVLATPATYRYPAPGGNAALTLARDALVDAQDAGVFVAIDGADVQWKGYVNVQYNSYWETRARG